MGVKLWCVSFRLVEVLYNEKKNPNSIMHGVVRGAWLKDLMVEAIAFKSILSPSYWGSTELI